LLRRFEETIEFKKTPVALCRVAILPENLLRPTKDTLWSKNQSNCVSLRARFHFRNLAPWSFCARKQSPLPAVGGIVYILNITEGGKLALWQRLGFIYVGRWQLVLGS
jgi:hypothetical protein